MSEARTQVFGVDWRIEAVLNPVGVGAGILAAYHAGQTGNWLPLMGTSMLLVLVVLFVTAE